MDTLSTLDNEINILSKDFLEIEKALVDQIDILASKIPDVYAGYADMIRTLADSTIQILQPGNRTSNRVAIAAEIAARSVAAYGEYKAAKEHNRMLARYMDVKRALASANIEKVKYLLPKITQKTDSTGRLLKKCSEVEYNLADMDTATIKRVATIQVKALNLYRANIFYLELCKYLKNEYKVWLSGKQESEFDMPDYYLINTILAEQLYGNDLLESYVKAAEATSMISGKQIMLLSDSQMTLLALSNHLCKINLSEAHPNVGVLIGDCGAVESYLEITRPFKEHVENVNTWDGIILLLGLLAIASIFCIAFLYLDAGTGAKWMLSILGVVATFKICSKGMKKAGIAYVLKGERLVNEADTEIETLIGKVERPDIDYEERNLLTSTISGFFK